MKGEVSIRTLTNNYQQKEINTFKAHEGIVRTIKLIDNGHIATGGEDNNVKIGTFNGELILELKHQNFVQAIEFLDNNTIISASYDGTIKTWKL